MLEANINDGRKSLPRHDHYQTHTPLWKSEFSEVLNLVSYVISDFRDLSHQISEVLVVRHAGVQTVRLLQCSYPRFDLFDDGCNSVEGFVVLLIVFTFSCTDRSAMNY
jgi:hypothetical protein